MTFKFSEFLIQLFISSFYLNRSSNFKRQNTIDAATIKENTARLASQGARPVSAQPKTSSESG